MNQNTIIAVAFNVLMSGLFISCAGPKDSENSNEKSDTTAIQKIEAIKYKEDKPILDYLRSLKQEKYGGVSHLKDTDFQVNDDEKRFVQYRRTEDESYRVISFKQLASGNRAIFIKTMYDRYKMGVDLGYNDLNGIDLIEYKNGEWIDRADEIPQKWKKEYFTCFLSPDNEEMELYSIRFDKKNGNEIAKELVETAIWKDDKFTVIKTSERKKSDSYKIIVLYTTLAAEETSEDWAFFAEDISSAFKDEGVIVVENNGSKAIIDNENLSMEIDLTEILKKNNITETGSGYIFIENGKEPQYAEYAMSDQTIKAAEKYFSIKAGN